MDNLPERRERLAAIIDLRRAMLMARSEGHADQYETESLQRALPILPEPQQTIVRRVLDRRRKGETTRITG